MHPTALKPCLPNQSCWQPDTTDVVSGDIGLEAALRIVVDRGDNAVVAQRLLAEEEIMSTSFSTDEKNQKKLWRFVMISVSWKCAVILIWFVMVWCLPSSAKADNFWEDRAVGWHWYQDPEENQPVSPDSTVTHDPIATMEALHHQVQQTLDQAILNPTEDNMRQYIALQNQLGERAQHFSEVWKSVLLNYPELDFSLQHPTNNLAKQIDLDQCSSARKCGYSTICTA